MDADPSSREYEILLPGEAVSMTTRSKRDVEHWIGVYAELCQFKETLLRSIEEQQEKTGPEGRVEVDHDDMVFRHEYERLRRRLRYWQRQEAARD